MFLNIVIADLVATLVMTIAPKSGLPKMYFVGKPGNMFGKSNGVMRLVMGFIFTKSPPRIDVFFFVTDPGIAAANRV